MKGGKSMSIHIEESRQMATRMPEIRKKKAGQN